MKRPLLLPVVPLYAAGVALRELRLERGWEPVRKLHDPVISIGNLSTGGSGKTPFTIALVHLLSARGWQVDVLSRGYGRRRCNVAVRVDPNGSSDEYGDEPLLIARKAGVPVYVAAERYAAGRLAESEAVTSQAGRVHLLDDGFQHRQLARDIDILLLNREDWHDYLLPAGNLRETRNAAKRASVIAIPSDEARLDDELRGWGWTGPIWRMRRRMDVPHIEGPVTAFCGIGRSEQFFAGLRGAGMVVAGHSAFADHHRYTVRDVESLVAKAGSTGSIALVTTEKDEVRLGKLGSLFPPTLPLKAARLSIEIGGEEGIVAWIEQRVAVADRGDVGSGSR
ncbi:MAG TPA: tetraacyldisaccharide 4'-kinase [Terracidiphilus sp.]|jgi:tetraacyldisaccharide 4'-kinase